jgi:phage gp36-like protein
MVAYATIDDVKDDLPAAFFLGPLAPTDAQVQQKIEDVSAEADGYIASKYTVPLSTTLPYDRALVHAVVHMVIWHLFLARGFNPDNPADVAIRMMYQDSVKWLERLADGKIRLGTAQGDPPSMQPDVATSCPRGLGRGITGPWGGSDWGI